MSENPGSMEFILILLAYGSIIFAASYGISNVVYKRLERAGNSSARTIRIVTLILSFLVLFFGIAVLIISNIRLER
jgi:hypothetical protein